jgi:hypothetical protein
MFDIRTLQKSVGVKLLLWLNRSKEKSTSCTGSLIAVRGEVESEHPKNRNGIMSSMKRGFFINSSICTLDNPYLVFGWILLIAIHDLVYKAIRSFCCY